MAAYVLGCDTARVRVTTEEKASNPRGWSASPAASLCAATRPAGRTLLARYWIPAAASCPRPGIRPRLWVVSVLAAGEITPCRGCRRTGAEGLGRVL
jgi:hypothetical protein